MKKDRKVLITLLAGFLAILLTLIGILIFLHRCVVLDGRIYNRAAENLDFRGHPLSQMEKLPLFSQLKRLDLRDTGTTRAQRDWLQEKLPDCQILWELEFQGQLIPPDAAEIRVPVLRAEDPEQLKAFPKLKKIYIEECRDYGALDTLKQQLPDCVLNYTVELGGGIWAPVVRHLVLKDVEPAEIYERLPYLERTETVTLVGALPEPEALFRLQRDFPELEISWRVLLGSQEIPGTAEAVDLWRAEVRDPEELLQQLPYLPDLKAVDLRGTSFTNAQKRELVDSCPELEFLWDIQLGEQSYRADAEEVELDGVPFGTEEELKQAISLFTNLKKITVLDSGLSNETLDAVNQAFPEIRVVWNMDIGGLELRTDALYYAPNKYKGLMVNDEILKDLRYCTDMLCVDIGHRPVKSCEWAAYMPHLKYLILADTGMQDVTPLKDLKELVFLELFITPLRDYSPLLGCTALEDLNLCYSYGSTEPIEQMTWLKRLWWDGPSLPRQQLRESLPDTQIEFDSASSTGAGWREGQNYYDMRDLIGMHYMVG